MTVRRVAALLPALCALVAPAAATAGTSVSLDAYDDSMRVAGGGSEPQVLRIVVSEDRRTIRVSDDGGPVSTSDPACAPEAASIVCTASTPPERLSIRLGYGDDRVEVVGDLPATIDAGPGRDRVLGGAGDDVLRDDELDLFAPDLLDGREGRDRLDVGTEAPTSWRVDLDAGYARVGSVANVVRGVEDVSGGEGDDVLIGDEHANVLDGGGGNDRLDGRQGDDTLLGDAGDDTLLGGFGADRLGGPGEVGADRLGGGLGPDVLDAATGDDRLRAGPGDRALTGYGVDRVTLAAGARADLHGDWLKDRVTCDAGARVVVDVGDDVAGDCRPRRVRGAGLLQGAPEAIPWRMHLPLDRMSLNCVPFLPERPCGGSLVLRRGRRVVRRSTFSHGSPDGRLVPLALRRRVAAGHVVRLTLVARIAGAGLPAVDRLVLLPDGRV